MRPGICYGRAISNNEDTLSSNLFGEIVGSKGFAETGFCVPEELTTSRIFLVAKKRGSFRWLLVEVSVGYISSFLLLRKNSWRHAKLKVTNLLPKWKSNF